MLPGSGERHHCPGLLRCVSLCLMSLITGPVSDRSVSQQQVAVLLVSASFEVRRALRERLVPERWAVREAESGADALEKLLEAETDVLLLDTRLPDLRPEEFRELVRTQFPELQMLTVNGPEEQDQGRVAAGRPEEARVAGELAELLRFGEHGVMGASARGLPVAGFRTEPLPSGLRAAGATAEGWQGMVGGSAAMQRVYYAARLVAKRDTSVLISGESGTGKDLVARGIHVVSAREKQPYVVINCAAIPETLLESELFGYTKGSFTGAVQSRIGRIHAAHGGTLFLDEIGEMPLPLQSKLLRFLEGGEVQRIGDTDVLKVDVRVIAATNADLKRMAGENRFREDLYYRLAVFPIRLPPLRERMEDLPSLVASFMARFAPGVGVSAEAQTLLQGHSWPGNVRELRNALERASLFAEGAREIRAEDVVL